MSYLTAVPIFPSDRTCSRLSSKQVASYAQQNLSWSSYIIMPALLILHTLPV